VSERSPGADPLLSDSFGCIIGFEGPDDDRAAKSRRPLNETDRFRFVHKSNIATNFAISPPNFTSVRNRAHNIHVGSVFDSLKHLA
jgi:hypothetical protein